MFLTRIGFGSTVVVTGDITQIDLPHKTLSGLKHAVSVLSKVKGISFTHFNSKDVVRHPVQRIVEAYTSADEKNVNRKNKFAVDISRNAERIEGEPDDETILKTLISVVEHLKTSVQRYLYTL